jgi:hypothetical protein
VLPGVTGPACRGSLVPQGGALVSFGCHTESVGAGGDGPFRGGPGSGHMTLRRRNPLTGRGLVQASKGPCPQLAHPGLDGGKAPPDLVPAALREPDSAAMHPACSHQRLAAKVLDAQPDAVRRPAI